MPNTDLLDYIIKVGHALQLNQQTISTAMMLYHRYSKLEGTKIKQDPYIILIMTINLALKINDYQLTINKIVDQAISVIALENGNGFEITANSDSKVHQAELDFSIETDFEYDYGNFYDILNSKCTDFAIEEEIYKTAHIILNDSFRSDLFMRHSKRKIVHSILFLALKIHRSGNKDPIIEFLKSFNGIEKVVEEILDFYLKN